MIWAIGSQATRPIASSLCRLIIGLRADLIRQSAASTGSPWGGAHGARVVDPLPENADVTPLDLLELEALPEPLVEVAQLVDPPGADAQCPADRLGRPVGVLGRAAIEGSQGDPARGRSQLLDELGDLGPAPIAQGDVENPLDAVLLIVDGGAGADQDDLGHSCDGEPAWGAGPLPRSRPRWIAWANTARAAA